MILLKISGLSHKFAHDVTVLSDIHLQIQKGSIYGFLGPNGAGKTTTLKLILGLLKKQSGIITIFDKDFANNRVGVLNHIGSLIESPSFYGHLTAIENLKVFQKIYQCPIARIGEVLHYVDLPDTGKKKVSQFSLGMKQRIGIAIALLNNPTLLILDEPTNGLDPNGMVEMRELLLKLNREKGTTILISSHLLSEIEKLVTHIGVINKGQMLFEGTISELREKQKEISHVSFETSSSEQTAQIIRSNNLVPRIQDQKVLSTIHSKEEIARINRELVKNDIELYEVKLVRNDLETIFMNMINN